MSGFLGGIIGGSGGGSTSLGGDLSGTAGSASVTKIQGKPIQNTAPSDGQVLTWNAGLGEWCPEAPTGGTSVSVDGYGIYNCASSISVSNVVYLMSTSTVGLASAMDATKLAIGVVSSKNSSTIAVVQYAGENGSFSGLTAGAEYYLSVTAGVATSVAPNTTGNVVQKIGFAKNSTTLVIEIDEDFVQL
jgi:hypothetical protein